MRVNIAAIILTACALGQKAEILMGVPRWIMLFDPENQRIDSQTSEKVSVTYRSTIMFDPLVGRYEMAFREATKGSGAPYDEFGNGRGVTFAAVVDDVFCEVDIDRHYQPGPFIKINCENTKTEHPSSAYINFATAHPKPIPPRPLPIGMHQIEYLVEGDCGEAGLTYRNSGGGTEQRDLDVPSKISFRAQNGSFLYISAQKKGREGAVKVSISIDGVIVRRSTSTSPFGIASASGRL